MVFHQGNIINKKTSPTHCHTENWSQWNQSLLLKKKNEKKSNSQLMRAQRISQSFQEDKKYRCKLTKPSSVGTSWKPHHWKFLSLRKKKYRKLFGFCFFSLEETHLCLAPSFLRIWVHLYPLQAEILFKLFLKTFV